MTLNRLSLLIKKYTWLIAIELAVFGTLATFFFAEVANDMTYYYVPFAQGCIECGYVPYFAYWFLWPVAFISQPFLYALWTALTFAILLGIVYKRQANPLVLLLSFPMFAQIWTGQLDALIILGIALAMGLFSQNPHIRGFGLLLAVIKPQLSILFIITLAWQMRLQFLRLLPVPIVAALISFIQFGWDWPYQWYLQAQTLPLHEYRMTALLIFPWGLITLITPFLIRDKDRQLQCATLAATTIPQYSIYSYVVFLTFLKPTYWWAVPLSYIWMLIYPWAGKSAHIIEIIFPLLILGRMIWLDRFEAGRVV